MRRWIARLFWVTLLAPAITSCSLLRMGAPSPWPADVEKALTEAGPNRAQLEQALNHYRASGDSLKLKAASYLIRHMAGHSFALLSLCDSAEVEVELDVLDYPDYETLMAKVDEIEDARGELDYKRSEILPDLEHITAKLLIENIDLAFRAWQERPWACHLSFHDFCAYVLPYRGSNEPLGSWRPHFLEHFHDLPERMENPTDPIEAARLINDDIRGWFKFDSRFYLHPTDQGLSEMLTNQIGRCEDMTNLAIYSMRANGLAVTSDYTPHWANSGNNHAWNAILNRDGRVVIFMGAEAHPGEYRLGNKLAKVYRKTFARQPQNLVFQKPEWEQVPGWLSGKNYLDVSADYMDVSDVTLQLEKTIPDSVNFAYLCVFNSGQWRAIHWAPIRGRRVTFGDMGRDIAYLPTFYVDKKLEPAGRAFILEEDGRPRYIAPQLASPTRLSLTATTRRAKAQTTDGIAKVFLEAGREYELFYWEDEWLSAGTAAAGTGPLEFSSVPAGALYWMVAKDSRKDERIFTYEQDAQVWW